MSNSTISIKEIEAIAQTELGPNIDYIESEGHRYMLCTKRETKTVVSNPNKVLRFLVIDLINEEVIYKDNIVAGQVVWSGPDKIRITYTTGMSVGPQNQSNIHSYFYDLVGKKREEIESEKR